MGRGSGSGEGKIHMKYYVGDEVMDPRVYRVSSLDQKF